MALKGLFVPLVGHNVFIRRSALASMGYWHEHRVSEDFDLAIRLYARGWHGKYAQVHGLEFTEYASRTYSEDAMKEYRYTYGLLEMMFSGTIEWGKTRLYDAFYMILYFIQRINNALLFPYIAIITISGHLQLMFFGYLFCFIVYIFVPVIRTVLLRKKIKKEYLFRISESFLLFVTFAGCTFPAGAGAVKYFINTITKKESSFPATSVSTLTYSFKEGCRFLYKYFLKNKGVLVVSVFCVERMIHVLMWAEHVRGAQVATVFELSQIAFAPVVLTPQLFHRIQNRYFTRKESNNMLQCLNGSAFFKQAALYIAEHPDDSLFLYAIEIDNFHVLNMWYGHDEGEAYAEAIGNQLAILMEKYGGIPGHNAGGNFMCLVPNGDALLNEVQKALSDYINEHTQYMGFFPLLSVYNITDKSMHVEAMYERALLALDNIRGNLKEHSVQYDPDMDRKLIEEVKMLTDVRRGIEEDEFTFHVQPVMDLATKNIVGIESLVRWKHREKGLVPPGEFIPVLEKAGLTMMVELIVWEKVIAWLGKRIKSKKAELLAAIFISRADIVSMNVPERLKNLCDKYKVPYNYLTIEIMGGVNRESSKDFRDVTVKLKEIGFFVNVDGFGDGYASMNMMMADSFDVVTFDLRKLEGHGVNHAKRISIFKGVVESAHMMHAPVLVKAVETADQEKSMMECGCKYAQGFYYYKPMSIEDFEKLMKTSVKVGYDEKQGMDYIKHLVGFGNKSEVSVPEAVQLQEEDKGEKSNQVTKSKGVVGVFVKTDSGIIAESIDDRINNYVGANQPLNGDNFDGMEDILTDAASEPENYAMGLVHVKNRVGDVTPLLLRAALIEKEEDSEKFFCDFIDMRRFKGRLEA